MNEPLRITLLAVLSLAGLLAVVSFARSYIRARRKPYVQRYLRGDDPVPVAKE